MKVTAKQLMGWLAACDLQAQSYSGRAMYGRQCVGVTVSDAEERTLAVRLLRSGIDDSVVGDSDEVTVHDVLDAIENLMDDARSDSMGHDIIVYWPSLAWDAAAATELGIDGDEQEER